MLRLSFDFKLKDFVCRFDVLYHIIIGASFILTQISFEWIINNNDDDITTTTTTIITKVSN